MPEATSNLLFSEHCTLDAKKACGPCPTDLSAHTARKDSPLAENNNIDLCFTLYRHLLGEPDRRVLGTAA
ncbi:hypothetical protein [Streptomyces avermitilis]|uniref:hypothetical protein n=1 Tax=Streptomyces avermitilis TaxID=33903 RepID=UPI003816ACA1